MAAGRKTNHGPELRASGEGFISDVFATRRRSWGRARAAGTRVLGESERVRPPGVSRLRSGPFQIQSRGPEALALLNDGDEWNPALPEDSEPVPGRPNSSWSFQGFQLEASKFTGKLNHLALAPRPEQSLPSRNWPGWLKINWGPGISFYYHRHREFSKGPPVTASFKKARR